jgi:hypothetical protein
MNKHTKLILALQQTENIYKLLEEGPYAAFFASHLLPIKFEIERQLNCLTNTNPYTKLKESNTN